MWTQLLPDTGVKVGQISHPQMDFLWQKSSDIPYFLRTISSSTVSYARCYFCKKCDTVEIQSRVCYTRLMLTPMITKSRKMKCKTLENIRHNFFFTSGLQGNLNGKYKIIPSDGKKESNEERADTPRPLPPKVVRIPIFFSSFLKVFWLWLQHISKRKKLRLIPGALQPP